MAAKTPSTLLNMVLTLAVVTLVASATLGYVYELTKGPIAEAKRIKQENAIKEVVPEFDNAPGEERYMLAVEGNDSITVFPAMKNGELVGVAIKTYDDGGFTERIHIMVGLLPDGTIHNTAVLGHKETPGLGDKMEKKKSPWSNQFSGKNPATYTLKVTKDGGDVDAITAATISSRAFVGAVDRAYKTYMDSLNK